MIRKRNQGPLDYYASIGIPDAVETNPRVFSTLYVGYSNEHQWTPFHHAACLGDIRSLQILLKHFPHASCINPELREHYFFEPSEVALFEEYVEAASLLGNKRSLEDLLKLANAIVERGEASVDFFSQDQRTRKVVLPLLQR